MPEKKKEKFQIYENVSINELNSLLDATPNLYEKFAIAEKYLLCHGLKGEARCSFEELLHAAKTKLLESVIEARKRMQPRNDQAQGSSDSGKDNQSEEEKREQEFLDDPVSYMAAEARSVAESMPPEEYDEDEDYRDFQENCEKLSNALSSDEAKAAYEAVEKEKEAAGAAVEEENPKAAEEKEPEPVEQKEEAPAETGKDSKMLVDEEEQRAFQQQLSEDLEKDLSFLPEEMEEEPAVNELEKENEAAQKDNDAHL